MSGIDLVIMFFLLGGLILVAPHITVGTANVLSIVCLISAVVFIFIKEVFL